MVGQARTKRPLDFPTHTTNLSTHTTVEDCTVLEWRIHVSTTLRDPRHNPLTHYVLHAHAVHLKGLGKFPYIQPDLTLEVTLE